jgi:hypothetical protein
MWPVDRGYAILREMSTTGTASERVADRLHRSGLHEIAEILLEVSRPFSLLGAQCIYLLEPLAGPTEGFMRDLANVLEDPEQREALLVALRRESEQA